MTQFFQSICVLLFISSTITLADPKAQQKCRDIFKQDADSCSHYSHEGCQLHCLIHSKWQSAEYTNGAPCPANGGKVCSEGRCIAPLEPQLGYIDIQFGRGQFNLVSNYYVVACLRNSSQIFSVNYNNFKHPNYIPIHQNPINTNSCITACSSKAIPERNPVWNQVCEDSDKFLFLNKSRVFFDVYDYHGKKEKLFITGSSITIEEVLHRGFNNQDIVFSLPEGQKLYVRITYSLKDSKKIKNKVVGYDFGKDLLDDHGKV